MALTKKRNPFLSSFLSLLIPGLGQLYNGELKKAVIFYMAQFALFIPPFVIGLQYTPRGLFIILLIVALFYFFAMGEATVRSFKLKKILLKPYNKWYVYCLIIISANLIAGGYNTVFRESLIGIKPFYLPSASNEPTLLIGDQVIVDLHKKTPINGTFIVFKSPEDPKKDYLKRVIATQGDLLEIKNKLVFVNNVKLNEPYIVHVDNKVIPKNVSSRDNFGPIQIPTGKVFVMGDNRDHSFDSRFFGPIDESAIVGTTLYIYWARDKKRIGMQI
jgi:signal peptidase I